MPRPDYLCFYVVMIKPKSSKNFVPLMHSYRGDDTQYVTAFRTRAEARAVCRTERNTYGPRRAYVQKCGAIR